MPTLQNSPHRIASFVALALLLWAGWTAQAGPEPLPPVSPPPAEPQPTVVPAWFSFVIPPFDSEKTATDVSWLNGAPAGANGFLHAQGEHFVDERGHTVRLWGVNISFEGAFPPKEQAPDIAAHLAKFGFNAVRFHQYEGYGAPRGLWKSGDVGPLGIKVPREIDPVQLDKFDFFASELIKRGIYIDLNQHVGRKVNESEGFPQAAALPEKDKGVDYYDEKLIAAQKEFTRTLLTHVNPYTGRAYCDEPGVCAIEMDNESSLLAKFLDGTLASIPADYQKPLAARWNGWLRARYNEEELRNAWTEVQAPVNPLNLMELASAAELFHSGAPNSQFDRPLRSLRRFEFVAAEPGEGEEEVEPFGGPEESGAALPAMTMRIEKLGTLPWAFQVQRDALDLDNGQLYTVTFRARADSPRRVSVNLWRDEQPYQYEGFSGYADLTTEWKEYKFSFRPVDAEARHSRLSWNLGNQLGTVQLSDIELREGGRIAAPEDWTLGHGVPLIDFESTPVRNVRRDFAEFLGGVEGNYVADMREFLKEQLHVKCPIWQTQAQFGGWGGVLRETASDAIDLHAYWKHPDYSPGADGSNWRVGNASMTTAAGSDPLSAFGLFRVDGKPYVMSEWNSGQPSDYSAESLLMAAAYASWQDWAGVFIFDYHSSGPYDRDKFFEFFSIDTHPAKMATAPAAALLFRRPNNAALPTGIAPSVPGHLGDVAPSERALTLTMPLDDIWPEVADDPGDPSSYPIQKTWFMAGAARTTGLRGRPGIRFGDVPFPTVSHAAIDTSTSFTSDTGQLNWSRADPAHFTVDTPQSKVAIGFYAGQQIQLSGLSIEMPATPVKFAVFSLASLEDVPVGDSKRLLLTTAARVENKDMVWNEAHNSLLSWGTGPTMAEGVSAELQIALAAATAPLSWKVWSLDGYGNRKLEVPAQYQDGILSFEVGPEWRTLWYEIAPG